MGHGIEGRASAPSEVDPASAKTIAATLQALAAPSRLLILGQLRKAPATVGDLARSVRMEQSAVSHQLRLLRTLGLVDDRRQGRTVVYTLYDNHVAQLLDQAIYHVEHLRMGKPDRADIA